MSDESVDAESDVEGNWRASKWIGGRRRNVK